MAGETLAIALSLFRLPNQEEKHLGSTTPELSALQGRGSRAAGGIDNQLDTTAAILHRFAYRFGIEGKVSIQRPCKLRLDVTVVGHVERGSLEAVPDAFRSRQA